MTTRKIHPDDYSLAFERVLGQFAGELLRTDADDLTAVITFVGRRTEDEGGFHYTGDSQALLKGSVTLIGSVIHDLVENGVDMPREIGQALAALMIWADPDAAADITGEEEPFG